MAPKKATSTAPRAENARPSARLTKKPAVSPNTDPSKAPSKTVSKKRSAPADGKADAARAVKKVKHAPNLKAVAKPASAEKELSPDDETDQQSPTPTVDSVDDSDEECTCGNCLEGWLSPRICMQLKEQAGYMYDISMDVMEEDVDVWESGKGRKKLWSGFHYGEYVPNEILRGRVKFDFVLGFLECFKLMAKLLEEGTVPSSENLFMTARASKDGQFTHIKAYWERFGDLDAMDYIIRAVVEELKGNEENAVDEDELKKLPACRNDRDWDITMELLTL